MDPQATWDMLLDAYSEGDWCQVQELADALLNWLRADGFPPETIVNRPMGADWNRYLARAVCEFAAELANRVLVDTNGIPAGVPFSLSCCFCDCDGPNTYAKAVTEGWTDIEFTPDGLAENFFGRCPQHSNEED